MRGSIRVRTLSDGRRVYDVVVDFPRGPDGKRRQKWFRGFRTRKEAEAKLAQVLAALGAGTFVEPSRQSMAKFLLRWLEGVRGEVRRTTFDSYEMHVRKYLVPYLGSILLQALSTVAIKSFYAELQEKGLGAGTVRRIHATLHRALRDAVRLGEIVRNPASHVGLPKHQTPEMQTWTGDEARRFLDHVREDRLHALYVLVATTGLRRGEVLGLRWRDVDLEAGRASVRQTVVRARGELHFDEPKTRRSRRSVKLDPGTVAILKAHRARQAEERLAFGPGYHENLDLVFARGDGSPLDPGRVSHEFARHVRASGVPRIRFHDLRHTYATLALQAGVHPKVVSERLGHSSVSITLDVYSHMVPGMEEEAADRVAKLVLG